MSRHEFAAMNAFAVVRGPSFFRASTVIFAVALACARPAPPPTPPTPAPDTSSKGVPPLPPVPEVRSAPLAIRIVYPGENQVIASRDSNFLLGSVGSGDATLTINGIPVPIAANGAFIAFLPNPPAEAPRYELVATRGTETAQLTLPIRYPAPRPVLSATGPLQVDSASLSPSRNARLRYRSDEPVRVSIRAPYNAQVWVEHISGKLVQRYPLVINADLEESALQAARGLRTPTVTTGAPSATNASTFFLTDVPARHLTRDTRIVAARGRDTVRLPLAVPAWTDTSARMVGVLRSTNAAASDTDRVVIGRPSPGGTYKWLLMGGTLVEMTGQQGDFTRVRLDESLEVWVSSSDIVTMPAGTPVPRLNTSGFRVTPADEWVDVNIGMSNRPAFYVEPNGNELTLTLYGVQANPEISPIYGNDTLIRRIAWEQVATDRVRMTFTLSQPVFGWLPMWDEQRRAFVFRVRRAPTIDAQHPLAGLTIAVDAGHPPAGTTGPTGFYEGDAVLPVAEMVAEMLRVRGATPVMTRTTRDPLGLTERTVMSRRANAHAFVSIHLNAFGDGVNPFTNNGTSTLFFHQHSEPLAREVQRALMKRMPFRDLGIHYQNLAVARPTWYPSVLAEGAFLIMPDQEAAMRNPAFQRRYAEAMVEGLEVYFRKLAKGEIE